MQCKGAEVIQNLKDRLNYKIFGPGRIYHIMCFHVFSKVPVLSPVRGWGGL